MRDTSMCEVCYVVEECDISDEAENTLMLGSVKLAR